MTDDTAVIRSLIERWAHAVHAGDLEGVLADHAPDIVMFDVPPPNDGVRGIDAYRSSWQPFFEWQRQGAVFDIVDLDVTAGTDVAFAHALLRCGTAADSTRTRTTGSDSPSGCARRTAAGSSLTSTTRSRRPEPRPGSRTPTGIGGAAERLRRPATRKFHSVSRFS